MILVWVERNEWGKEIIYKFKKCHNFQIGEIMDSWIHFQYDWFNNLHILA